MHKSSITEISLAEIDNVSGGVLNHKKILEGALASGAIKTCAYYIEILFPKGTKKTFLGDAWNGLVKGFSGFLSTVAIGIGGAYIVAAVQKNPIEDHHD